MRNKFFKFNENYAKVIKHLDDKQAGQYVRIMLARAKLTQAKTPP